MADKDRNGEQIDDDILRCKADILRSRDVMPPYKQEPKTGKAPTPPTDIKEIPIQKDAPKSPASAQNKNEIPQFDLAEEIMAEQRRITAIKRKAPGKKMDVPKGRREVEPISYALEQPMPEQSEESRLIAEIVARDIRKFCEGEISDKGG